MGLQGTEASEAALRSRARTRGWSQTINSPCHPRPSALLRLAGPTFVQPAGKLREPGANSILRKLFATTPINTTKVNKTLHLQAAKSSRWGVGGHLDEDTKSQLLRDSRTGHQFLQWFKHCRVS